MWPYSLSYFFSSTFSYSRSPEDLNEQVSLLSESEGGHKSVSRWIYLSKKSQISQHDQLGVFKSSDSWRKQQIGFMLWPVHYWRIRVFEARAQRPQSSSRWNGRSWDLRIFRRSEWPKTFHRTKITPPDKIFIFIFHIRSINQRELFKQKSFCVIIIYKNHIHLFQNRFFFSVPQSVFIYMK